MTITELKSLTGSQLRILVAEAEGYQQIQTITGSDILQGVLPPLSGWVGIPRYSENRDDIVDAILRRFSSVDEQMRFSHAIDELLYRPRDNDLGMYWKIATASAEDLCRAFLLALPVTDRPTA